jgi:hypothetical protein
MTILEGIGYVCELCGGTYDAPRDACRCGGKLVESEQHAPTITVLTSEERELALQDEKVPTGEVQEIEETVDVGTVVLDGKETTVTRKESRLVPVMRELTSDEKAASLKAHEEEAARTMEAFEIKE